MTVYDEGAYCKHCGYEYDSAAGCKCDPYHNDTAAQVKVYTLGFLLLAILVGLTIAVCLSMHGTGPDVKTYHSASWNR